MLAFRRGQTAASGERVISDGNGVLLPEIRIRENFR
ncbi:hypothetical protein EC971742_1572, partial [Escherichia coli 97.1742]